jgi:hypothetical protein
MRRSMAEIFWPGFRCVVRRNSLDNSDYRLVFRRIASTPPCAHSDRAIDRLVTGQWCAYALNTGLPLCRVAHGIEYPSKATGLIIWRWEIRGACLPVFARDNRPAPAGRGARGGCHASAKKPSISLRLRGRCGSRAHQPDNGSCPSIRRDLGRNDDLSCFSHERGFFQTGHGDHRPESNSSRTQWPICL